MFATLIKRNNNIKKIYLKNNSNKVILPTSYTLNDSNILSYTLLNNSDYNNYYNNRIQFYISKPSTPSYNGNGSVKQHYYSNGILKKKSYILSLLQSKRLIAFTCYWSFISPNIPDGYSMFADCLSVPIFGLAFADLAISCNIKNKFYELSVVLLQQHRDSIESIIKQPFQIPSMNECKLEIHSFNSYENMSRLNKQQQQQQTTTSNDNSSGSIKDKTISLKKKLIKCTFRIKLDHGETKESKYALVEIIGETHRSLMNIGKSIPLDKKYVIKNLNITTNIESTEYKKHIIFEDLEN